MGGISRPPKRLLDLWVVLVNVPNTVSGVLPPETGGSDQKLRPRPSRPFPPLFRLPQLPTSERTRGLDRPPTAVTRPMVSPALAVPFEWVSEGGVEVAVVGRVVDG